MPMINEAIFCVMEGVGTPEAIDTVMKLGMNHPMGPLTLADFIGLDVCLAILNVLHDGLGDPKLPAVSPTSAHGRGADTSGASPGQGFYAYQPTATTIGSMIASSQHDRCQHSCGSLRATRELRRSVRRKEIRSPRGDTASLNGHSSLKAKRRRVSTASQSSSRCVAYASRAHRCDTRDAWTPMTFGVTVRRRDPPCHGAPR